LRKTREKLKNRGLGVLSADKEGTVKQVGFYSRQSSRSDTKPSRKTFKKIE
jgi:hypothetical protein